MLNLPHTGTFRKFSPNHSQRYFDEFVDHHDIFELDTNLQMESTAVKLVGRFLQRAEFECCNGLSTEAQT